MTEYGLNMEKYGLNMDFPYSISFTKLLYALKMTEYGFPYSKNNLF
jgi:hypothetical protein